MVLAVTVVFLNIILLYMPEKVEGKPKAGRNDGSDAV
jgi:hypothetical protein